MLAQYDTPDAILAHPADDFVKQFIGEDRALRRLALRTLGRRRRSTRSDRRRRRGLPRGDVGAERRLADARGRTPSRSSSSATDGEDARRLPARATSGAAAVSRPAAPSSRLRPGQLVRAGRPHVLLGLGARPLAATRSSRRSSQHLELTADRGRDRLRDRVRARADRAPRPSRRAADRDRLGARSTRSRASRSSRSWSRSPASRRRRSRSRSSRYTLVILFPNIIAGLRARRPTCSRRRAAWASTRRQMPDARRAAARGAGDHRRPARSRSSRRSRSRRSPRSSLPKGLGYPIFLALKEPTPFKTEIYSAGALAVALALACDLVPRRCCGACSCRGRGRTRDDRRRRREPAHVRRCVPVHRRPPRLPRDEGARAARALRRGARRSRS